MLKMAGMASENWSCVQDFVERFSKNNDMKSSSTLNKWTSRFEVNLESIKERKIQPCSPIEGL